MQKLIIILALGFLSFPLYAHRSAFSVSVDDKQNTMLVYVNGKLINGEKKRYMRQKNAPGFHVVKVKVYDDKGKLASVITQRIYVKSGFENHYQINLKGEHAKTLKKMPLYPLYSNYFYNPSLYAKNGLIA